MTEPELYTQPSKEERRRMNEAMARIEAESSRKPTPKRKPASSRRRNKRRSTGRTPDSGADDNVACVSLDSREWYALLRVLPRTCRNADAERARRGIARKLDGASGQLEVWGTVEGFTGIQSELLSVQPGSEPAGWSEACRVACEMVAQVSKTMKW